MNYADLPCMISFGFIVSLRLCEILCIVTVLPPVVDEPCPVFDDDEIKLSRTRYGSWGNAKRSATAAKHISIQMKKFCQP